MAKVKVFLSLGSNSGDRFNYLEKASKMISEKIGTIIKKSAIYEADSWGYEDNKYLNSVIVIESALSPTEILKKNQLIESELGRKIKTIIDKNNKPVYVERTIDIDILFYGDEIVSLPELKIPHPNLHRRNFVLIPLNEIASRKKHPLLGISVRKMLKYSPDNESVFTFISEKS